VNITVMSLDETKQGNVTGLAIEVVVQVKHKEAGAVSKALISADCLSAVSSAVKATGASSATTTYVDTDTFVRNKKLMDDQETRHAITAAVMTLILIATISIVSFRCYRHYQKRNKYADLPADQFEVESDSRRGKKQANTAFSNPLYSEEEPPELSFGHSPSGYRDGDA
jgi:hypothetical protein